MLAAHNPLASGPVPNRPLLVLPDELLELDEEELEPDEEELLSGQATKRSSIAMSSIYMVRGRELP